MNINKDHTNLGMCKQKAGINTMGYDLDHLCYKNNYTRFILWIFCLDHSRNDDHQNWKECFSYPLSIIIVTNSNGLKATITNYVYQWLYNSREKPWNVKVNNHLPKCLSGKNLWSAKVRPHIVMSVDYTSNQNSFI